MGVARTVLGVIERGQRRELPAQLAAAMAATYGVTRSEIEAAWDATLEGRRQRLSARAAARRGRT
ncbi:hypothetical protein MHN80_23475 [Gordonia McavH-238-E]|uniref:hypothetical protein n=1 Tax=Gordonia sp. McavH-238-E TaxID=2917736 RepID=UPI001EF4C994|nr:hypothetical protein [Gordonia sp. McavH-238-E]MCG7635281.1 hypothetical protein [Gordonia sp. McavH-238-E]